MKRGWKDQAETTDGKATGKMPYTTPRLTVHGDVEEITKALLEAGVKNFTGSIPDTGLQ
jgi:hypothetical protein